MKETFSAVINEASLSLSLSPLKTWDGGTHAQQRSTTRIIPAHYIRYDTTFYFIGQRDSDMAIWR